MNAVLPSFISAGIIAFGLWVIVGSLGGGWAVSWTLMGVVPVVVGSFSLGQTICFYFRSMPTA